MTKAPQICTRETFYSIVSSPAVAEATAKARALVNASTDYINDIATHELVAKVKQEGLSVFYFQGIFTGTRHLKSECILNGLFMADIDGVPNPRQTWEEKRQLIEANFKIMLVHVTPSGQGLRFVGVADPNIGDLWANAVRLGELIGLKPDEACKDSSRASFAVPKDDILYIDEELFTFDNPDYDKLYGEQYRTGKTTSARKLRPATETTTTAAPAGQPTETVQPTFHGVPYTDIIACYWNHVGGEPSAKEHTRHPKLTNLAIALLNICDYDKATIRTVLPTYGLPDKEMDNIINWAVESSYSPYLKKPLREALEDCGISPYDDNEQRHRLEQRLKAMEERSLDRLDKIKLPPLLKAILATIDRPLINGALLASLVMIYTLCTRIRFKFYGTVGKLERLSGMTFIIGSMASGKSFITPLDKLLMEPIREADRAGWEAENQYKEAMEESKNKKEQPKKPHPVIRIIPMQSSNTYLINRIADAVDPVSGMHLHVYSCDTELDTAIRSSKGGAWAEKNDIYRKAFHNEEWGEGYMSRDAPSGLYEVDYNFVVSGTEDAFDEFIPEKTVLNGLATRMMIFRMPDQRGVMIAKNPPSRTAKQLELIRSAAYKLDKAAGEMHVKKLSDRMWEWCYEKAQLAIQEEDDELDTLRRRAALIGMRAGVAFMLAENVDRLDHVEKLRASEAACQFAEYIADYCLYTQYEMFAGQMAARQKAMADRRMGNRGTMRKATLYTSLPSPFTFANVCSADPERNEEANRKLLQRWLKKGYIERLDDKGNYRKTRERL